MGLLLSNAYKNINVYNIITTRGPARYEYFEIVINDNYEIYASSPVDFMSFDLRNIVYSAVDKNDLLTMVDHSTIFFSNLRSYYFHPYN